MGPPPAPSWPSRKRFNTKRLLLVLAYLKNYCRSLTFLLGTFYYLWVLIAFLDPRHPQLLVTEPQIPDRVNIIDKILLTAQASWIYPQTIKMLCGLLSIEIIPQEIQAAEVRRANNNNYYLYGVYVFMIF